MIRKTCNRCGENKEISEYYKCSTNKDGYRNFCKSCSTEMVDYYNNREDILKRRKEKRHENREKNRTYNREYYRKNRERINRQRRIKYKKEGKSENDAEWRRRYELMKRMSSSNVIFHTPEEWKDLCKKYDYICQKCKKQFPIEKLTRDHIKPISKGGFDNIENMISSSILS